MTFAIQSAYHATVKTFVGIHDFNSVVCLDYDDYTTFEDRKQGPVVLSQLATQNRSNASG